MVLLPCLSSTSHSVAILAKLGAPLWPGAGDSSLWHCLGSSPWTCVLLSWAHTLNEAENSQNKQVLFFMHQQASWGSGAMAKGIRVQECLTVPWESGRERGAQRPGRAPSQLFPGSVTLPSQPVEPPGRLPAEAAFWQVFKR